MLVEKDNLKIRSADISDVNHLLNWWNSGDIMAHVEYEIFKNQFIG